MRSFTELAGRYRSGVDYLVSAQQRDSRVLILAPHGGKIEPGTSEICRAIAGADCSFYCLEGALPKDNRRLHITSTCFDEPLALGMLARADIVITVHGLAGREAEFVMVGGRDEKLGESIKLELEAGGFRSEPVSEQLRGTAPENLVNRGRTGRGVQLEISRRLRDSLVQDLRRRTAFSQTIRRAIAEHTGRLPDS